MRLNFLNSTGCQLFNAHSIIKIGQKLASVRRFKICTRAPKMTPLMKIFERGVKKKYSSNFKISYRSEFLFDFDNRTCVTKLRSRRIQQKYVIFFLRAFCTQNGQNMGVKNFKPILCLVGAY